MKRLIPMWIATVAGFVMIVAFFIPLTQGWGEVAAIWFDILQAIAFILGGGNLLKIHLKKVSDKPAGWGYSIVVLVSSPRQEYYGETFAKLSPDSIPDSLVFSEEGTIPAKASGEQIHAAARWQISEVDGAIRFRGWMRPDQKEKLLAHKSVLAWQCAVEELYEASQPQGDLAGRVAYYADHRVLSFTGQMTEAHREALLALEGDANWEAAVADLYDRTQGTTSVTVGAAPPLFDSGKVRDVLLDESASTLTVAGPMSSAQHDALLEFFPLARPMSAAERTAVLNQLRAAGPVAPEQEEAFHRILDGSWTVEQLHDVLDEAGKPQAVDKKACRMLAEQEAGLEEIDPKKMVGTKVTLNNRQVAALQSFAEDEDMTIGALVGRLESDDFTSAQETALDRFLGPVLTSGERKKALCFAMMKAEGADGRPLPLNAAQRDLLLADYRAQVAWRQTVGELFLSAHTVKFSWAGDYAAQGAPFWWLYEYMFKPLQATIFAMLAFYVASAAFRAFRAKNMEAILLLGTAFIILLGRTFAGVWLTDWISDEGPFRGLRVENLTVYIMQVFNTAGTRAIMIGIALGIASTSLKVLLGVDRSYLGSAEE
ncbi:MAG: hypothetical protein ACYSTY_03985 [Planctomycetota bacterium]